MAESNKMKDMPVNQLMIQMGILCRKYEGRKRSRPECADTGVPDPDADGGSGNRNRRGNECASCEDAGTGK